ncbi:GNAT family N-acetyltransferase [Dongia sp.]|uniref:GNAT family N-acetyltransferase n=1 Tax=Dongia sp. TaxID=1977262 RepID=UPI0035AF4DAC
MLTNQTRNPLSVEATKRHLELETPVISTRVERLYDDVFGVGRRHKASYTFRDSIAQSRDLSWVAYEEGELAGAIRYWPIAVGPSKRPALLLGPLAVASHRAGRGLGSLLMIKTLNLAARLGHSMILLVGDPGFYRRFGFLPASPWGFSMPGETRPERLQLLPLRQGQLTCGGEIERVQPVSATVLAWRHQPVPAGRR